MKLMNGTRIGHHEREPKIFGRWTVRLLEGSILRDDLRDITGRSVPHVV
jgi:hypothetical protein